MKRLLLFAAVLIVSCSASTGPDHAATGAGGAPSVSSSSSSSSASAGSGGHGGMLDGGGGSGGEGGASACVPAIGDICGWSCSGFWPHGAEHPDGCTCVAECPPPSALCAQPACSGIQLSKDGGPATGGVCSESMRAPGQPCASGVGTCDKAGACVPPSGACDTFPPGPTACTHNADCDDGNPCTIDLCLGAWCAPQPAANGKSCGVGKTCNAGACCAPGGVL